MVWARGLELCGYLIVKYVACMSKVYTEGGASQSARSTGRNPAEATPGYEQKSNQSLTNM